MKKKVHFMCTAFRDGFQSVYGARVFSKDFLPAVKAAAAAGIEHFEAGGGAMFQSAFFYNNENALAKVDMEIYEVDRSTGTLTSLVASREIFRRDWASTWLQNRFGGNVDHTMTNLYFQTGKLYYIALTAYAAASISPQPFNPAIVATAVSDMYDDAVGGGIYGDGLDYIEVVITTY